MSEPVKDDPNGIALAAFSYVFWGFMPLYWRLLLAVPPFEVTVHRIFWSALFCAIMIAVRHRWSHLRDLFRQKRTMAMLALTGVLISVNWTIFIYSVASQSLVEASLGYYITPLLSIGLGVLFLGEQISKVRLAAIVLAGLAVVIQSVALGHFSWIAVSLAVSFGLYGFFRKLTHVDALDALAIETWILFPITAGLVFFWGKHESHAFPHAGLRLNSLLVLAGPLTAVPLAMFAAGVRRIRLSTLGFLQYLNPTMTLLLATLGFGEHFNRTGAISFGFVWVAVVIVALEGRFTRFRQAATEVEPL
jgi:chloramphenicol-sensitive protein RarD